MIWVVLLGLAVQRFLSLPERSIELDVLGSPITLTITANTILGAVLAALAASGTEAVGGRIRARCVRRCANAGWLRAAAWACRGWETRSDAARALTPGATGCSGGCAGPLIMVSVLLMPLAPTRYIGCWG